jgi:hypothetical protein
MSKTIYNILGQIWGLTMEQAAEILKTEGINYRFVSTHNFEKHSENRVNLFTNEGFIVDVEVG